MSDLHLGDGGHRDNFAHMAGGYREHEFNLFLDYVEREEGELVIVGDLFELWQANMSRVLTYRVGLLDRLAEMGATYLIGNHDIDLMYFKSVYGMLLGHPLFSNLKLSHTIETNGNKILLIHGHEQDPYCSSQLPGIGRASAIYTGLKEDRNGGPLLGKYGTATVEARTLGRIGRFGSIVRRLRRQPSATQVIQHNMVKALFGYDALIFGHTHEPGQFCTEEGMLPIYNCGTWAEQKNHYVRIGPLGFIQVFEWFHCAPKVCDDTLIVE